MCVDDTRGCVCVCGDVLGEGNVGGVVRNIVAVSILRHVYLVNGIWFAHLFCLFVGSGF